MIPAPVLLTVPERRRLGHDDRGRLSREAHAVWQPASGRRDVVEQLIDADRGRIAALLPVRYGRMQADAFAFLRGAAPVMAADLGSAPATTLAAQSCGDAHLMNFGAHLSPESTPVFDVNDFDETLPAPFEWDLKRLASSLVVAAGTREVPARAARALARRAARSYRLQIAQLSQLPPLTAWRSRIDLEHAVEGIGAREVRRRERQRLVQVMGLSKEGAWRGLVDRQGTSLRLPERPPAVFRLGAEEEVAHTAFAAYHDSLAPEQLALMQRYRLCDVAFKAVGVGSVGTFCAIGLFADADDHTLLLQLKEARRSVLEPYAGDSAFANHGQRVVVGQRMMQASADVFLGWAALLCPAAEGFASGSGGRADRGRRAAVLRATLWPHPGARPCALGRCRAHFRLPGRERGVRRRYRRVRLCLCRADQAGLAQLLRCGSE